VYDVEYLLDQPAFDRALIVRYRTGVLVSQIRKRLEKILAEEGNYLSQSEPGAFCSSMLGSTFFAQYIPLCDWPRRKPKGIRRHAAPILGLIGEVGTMRGVLLAHFDDPIFKRAEWAWAKERCLVIEEPIVSAESVTAVVRYLLSASDIKPPPPNGADVIEYFKASLAREGDEELDQFCRRFDETILLHCDVKTGEFTAPPFDAIDALDRSYITFPLRQLVQHRRESSIDDLVEGLEVRLRKRALTLRMVFRDLHDASDRLFDGAAKDWGSFDRDATKERAILWGSLLLVFNQRSIDFKLDQEKLVPRADAALSEFDALAREFLARATGTQSHNPMGDLWTELCKVLELFCREEPSLTEEDEVPEDEDGSQYTTKAEGVPPDVKPDAQQARPALKKAKRKRPDVRVTAQARTIKTMADVLADRRAFSIWPIWIERLNSYLQPAVARRLELDEEEAA
jgi:hypothetical protein